MEIHTSYSYFLGLAEYIHNAINYWRDSFYLFADIYAINEKMQRIVGLAHDSNSVANLLNEKKIAAAITSKRTRLEKKRKKPKNQNKKDHCVTYRQIVKIFGYRSHLFPVVKDFIATECKRCSLCNRRHCFRKHHVFRRNSRCSNI